MLLLYLCCFVSVVLASLDFECTYNRKRAPGSIPRGRGRGSRIAGGSEVDTITQYPFAVQVYNSGEFCGGAIISDRYILTSAQCVDGGAIEDPQRLEVLAGDVVQCEGTRIPIAEAAVHPDWDFPYRYNHDIAYLRTAAPIEFRDEIQPIRLSYLKELEFTVVGWGFGGENTGGQRLNVLNELSLTLVPFFCQDQYPMFRLSDDAICGEPADKNGGICLFDEGDPAVNKDGTLLGLGSYWNGCGPNQGPSVFTYLGSKSVKAFVTENTGVKYDYEE